ncbi:MAG: right-handed parallel beta-helix repeat-containing protein [Planctomycetes bacterium]|nr:right-handed parallel beta-helix repeat-containing protein [Planctomycetota bacterium]
MKTLTEVEPRIAVNAANTPGNATSLFRITQPGSYYLTGNVTGVVGKSGIVITSGQVTLDLNGFRLEGASGRGRIAVDLQCVPDVVIKNGFISNWSEIGILGEDSTGLRIENVHMRNFPFCTVLVGEATVVLDSSISDSSDGYQLGGRSRVERCVVRRCTGTAIAASTGSLVADCTLNDNGGGIGVSGDGSVVRNNVIKGTGIRGIQVGGRNNRIEDNHVTGGNVGIRILTAGNYVAGNTVTGNTDNYDFVAGNQLNILLGEIPESIDWSANVTLAGSLTGVTAKDGITINADDVTLDLNGFALIGVAGSLDGVTVPAVVSNLTVRNGTVRDWDGAGVGADPARNSQFERLRVYSNDGGGLWIGLGSVATHCTALLNRLYGIRTKAGCVVTECIASTNVSAPGIEVNGRGCIVSRCTADNNGSHGIFAVNGISLISGCSARNNSGRGITASEGATITGCNATSNEGDGIACGSECRIVANNCYLNGAAGIHTTHPNNRIEGNNVNNNTRGIDVDSTRNIIIKNTASGNATNYDIAAGNRYGTIISIMGTGQPSVSGASAVGTLASTDPWANFSY